MWNDKRLSRIIKLELILTRALYEGHKAIENDKYKDIRSELKQLRFELGLNKHSNKNNQSNV